MYLHIKHLHIKHLHIKHLHIKHLHIKHLHIKSLPFFVFSHIFSGGGPCEFAPTSHHFTFNDEPGNYNSSDVAYEQYMLAGTPRGCVSYVGKHGFVLFYFIFILFYFFFFLSFLIVSYFFFFQRFLSQPTWYLVLWKKWVV